RGLLARVVAQLAADLQAVHARQVEVKHDRIEVVDDGKVQAGHAIGGEIDGMTAVLQVVAEVGGDVLIVFDDENAHAGGFHEVGQAWTARWARGSTGQGRDSGTGPRRRRVDRARTKEPRRCHRLGPKVLPRSPQSVGRPWDKETGA